MQLDQELQNVKSVAIAGHIRPDGDCVGSCLATYNYIRTHYPTVDVRVFGTDSDHFLFFTGADCICDATSCDDVFELCIVLDCGDANRLGDAIKFSIQQKRQFALTIM